MQRVVSALKRCLDCSGEDIDLFSDSFEDSLDQNGFEKMAQGGTAIVIKPKKQRLAKSKVIKLRNEIPESAAEIFEATNYLHSCSSSFRVPKMYDPSSIPVTKFHVEVEDYMHGDTLHDLLIDGKLDLMEIDRIFMGLRELHLLLKNGPTRRKCHGDFHTGNIIIDCGRISFIDLSNVYDMPFCDFVLLPWWFLVGMLYEGNYLQRICKTFRWSSAYLFFYRAIVEAVLEDPEELDDDGKEATKKLKTIRRAWDKMNDGEIEETQQCCRAYLMMAASGFKNQKNFDWDPLKRLIILLSTTSKALEFVYDVYCERGIVELDEC